MSANCFSLWGLPPQTLQYHGFAPGLHWGTSVLQRDFRPADSMGYNPQIKLRCRRH